MASQLHCNNHYAIQGTESRLRRYLKDALKMGLPLHVVTRNDDGEAWKGEICPLPDTPDVLIITPGNSAVVMDSSNIDDSKNDAEPSTFAFASVSDLNMSSDFRALFESLNHESALKLLLSKPIFQDADGAKGRKQAFALNYQYSSMNSTDRTHLLCARTGRCAPKLTSKYNGITEGWDNGSSSLKDSVEKNMVILTKIADSMDSYTGLGIKPFRDAHSTRHFASTIHPQNRLTGFTAIATPVNSDNELGAHVDRNNSSRKGCDQVIGSYQYTVLKHKNPYTVLEGTNEDIELYRTYFGGRSMAICDKMAHDGANIDRLYDDLVVFAESLSENRVNLPPTCNYEQRRESRWEPRHGIATEVHIDRTVFW